MSWLFRRRGMPPRQAPRRAAPPERTPNERSDWRSWDAVAEQFEDTIGRIRAVAIPDLLSLGEAGPGERALDVGTATATVVEAAATAVGSSGIAVGVERSLGLLGAARALRPAARLAAADILDLPFRDGTFSVVTANFVAASFRKLDTALFDLARVLRPGGRLAVSAWADEVDDLTRIWRNLLEETLGRETLRSAVAETEPWTAHLADKNKLEQTLRDAGFRPVRVERHRYRIELSREEYVRAREIEPLGRFTQRMLGPALWDRFRARLHAAYAETTQPRIVDFREALLAVGTKP